MNRRTFLRVLGSGLAAAVVAQALPSIEPAVPSIAEATNLWWKAAPGATCEPLTVEMMRRAFEKCSREPASQPQYFLTSLSVARRYGLVFDLDVA